MKMLKVTLLSLIYAVSTSVFLFLCTRVQILQSRFQFLNLTWIVIAAVVALVLLWYPMVDLTAVMEVGKAKWLTLVFWVPLTPLLVWGEARMFPIENPQFAPSAGLFFYILPLLAGKLLYMISINVFDNHFAFARERE